MNNEASRMATIQAAGFNGASIVAHMAWLRARHELLLARFPRAEWSREDAGRSDSSGSYFRGPPRGVAQGKAAGPRARGPAPPRAPRPRNGALLLPLSDELRYFLPTWGRLLATLAC